jgi:branched-chain amino acid transport system ATP-binding protein
VDDALLVVEGLRKSFAGVRAVDDVSFRVPAGKLVGVLGPNGAGKSTLFHLIAGHLRADAGRIVLGGTDITRLRPHQRAGLGIGLVFQNPRLFPGMTVLDNVMAGRHLHGHAGILSCALRLPRHWRDERAARRDAQVQLDELDLGGHAGEQVDGLPFGVARRVALARALGVADRLLLLDEPAAGLTGGERAALSRSIAKLRAPGRSILLVEHDVGFVAGIADTLLVLDRGAVLATGGVAEVLADPRVATAYSGVAA